MVFEQGSDALTYMAGEFFTVQRITPLIISLNLAEALDVFGQFASLALWECRKSFCVNGKISWARLHCIANWHLGLWVLRIATLGVPYDERADLLLVDGVDDFSVLSVQHLAKLEHALLFQLIDTVAAIEWNNWASLDRLILVHCLAVRLIEQMLELAPVCFKAPLLFQLGDRLHIVSRLERMNFSDF